MRWRPWPVGPPPQCIDQPFGGHHLVGPEHQGRKQDPLAGTERHGLAVVPDHLEWAQEPIAHPQLPSVGLDAYRPEDSRFTRKFPLCTALTWDFSVRSAALQRPLAHWQQHRQRVGEERKETTMKNRIRKIRKIRRLSRNHSWS